MKRLITVVVTLTMLLTLAACSSNTSSDSGAAENDAQTEGTGYQVGYANLADSDVNCRLTKEYFLEYAKQHEGMEVLASDAQNQIEKQIADIENFIAQGVDTIIALPLDFEALTPSVQAANEAGIPFIAFRAQISGGDYVYCGSNDEDAGKLQAEYCIENLPENAKVLYMSGTLGMNHTTLRMNGFKDLLAAERPDVTIIAEQDGNYDRAKGMQITEDWIQSYDEFDAIVCANDQMALGAIEALKGARRLEGVQVLGVDAVDDALVAIEAGEMAMSAFQNANEQAKACAEMASKLAQGESVEDIYIPFEAVTKDNVAEYMK